MSTESTPTKPFKPDKVSKKKMASYGMGPFIQITTSVSYDILVLYYYEVELGLASALVGLSFVIYAIWNMINDPLVGFLTDKPTRWSKKYGLRTPWILFAGILTIISYYFLYAVPDLGDVKSNPWPLFWYMVIITCIFDTFFSIFTTHYVGGFGNIFRAKDDRRMGSTIMMVIGLTSQLFLRAVIIANVIVYGDPSSFVRAAFIIAIVCSIALIFLIPGVYENEFVKKRYLQIYEFLETQKMPYFKLLKLTFKQKNYMAFLVAYTLVNVAQVLNRASQLYMFKEVLGFEVQTMAIIAVFLMMTLIPSIFFWSYIAKKIAHVNVWIISLVLFIVYYSNVLWVANLTHVLINTLFAGFISGAQVAILFSLIADTNDEVVDAAGRHVEATLMGVRNFFLRVSYLITGVIIAGVHIATGYVPGASTQTPLAILGIRIHAGGFPAIFMAIAAIIMIKLYDLKGEKKEQLMASLKAQRL